MRYLLLYTPAWSPTGIRPALESAQIEAREARVPRELVVDERPTVFVLDSESRAIFPVDVLRAFVDAGGAIVALGRDGEPDLPGEMPSELLSGFVRPPVGPRQLLVAVRAGYREAAARMETARARSEAANRSREIGELTRIGVALGTERDLKTLLELILTQARRITTSDAGSLYLVETGDQGQKRLRFRITQTYSKPDAPFVEFTIPVDRSSLAGYTAVTGEPLVIDDAYFLPPDVEYSINRSFDERHGYRTKSMLVLPMKDHKEEVIGVLQLINRKRDPEAVLAAPADVEHQVVPYSRRTVELVTALAGQAAVAIENSRLYEEIERLFEGFVKAAVHAIEQRDPTTFGHSGRVANMTVGLASVVDRAEDGAYRAVTFTREQIKEIRYAGLLHDFGKVGVREQVLIKAKKLYPLHLDLIRQRHHFVKRTAEREFWRKRAEFLESHDRKDYAPFHLTEEEMRYLTIPKGSLDETERLEIESHVTHTYRFLQQIPWTRELQDIPMIAYGHHEKLDGKGYPRRVTGEAIPIQTRMMTISDIYDALSAADRPYKAAVAPARALDIMAEEVRAGQLDQELFRLFVEGKVFQATV